MTTPPKLARRNHPAWDRVGVIGMALSGGGVLGFVLFPLYADVLPTSWSRFFFLTILSMSALGFVLILLAMTVWSIAAWRARRRARQRGFDILPPTHPHEGDRP